MINAKFGVKYCWMWFIVSATVVVDSISTWMVKAFDFFNNFCNALWWHQTPFAICETESWEFQASFFPPKRGCAFGPRSIYDAVSLHKFTNLPTFLQIVRTVLSKFRKSTENHWKLVFRKTQWFSVDFRFLKNVHDNAINHFEFSFRKVLPNYFILHGRKACIVQSGNCLKDNV